jgi:hypothetical protein
VKTVRQRGRTSLSGGGRVVVTVRDSLAGDLRAVISITEGQDGITRVTVTPSDVCAVSVNDVETTNELTTRAKRS